MSVINLPPMLKQIIGDLEKRIRKLEQPNTFAVPSQTSDPAELFDGMIWYNTTNDQFMTRDNGVTRRLGELKYYGSFYDTTTQNIGNVASVYAISVNTTDAANGVSITSGSQIRVSYAGYYNIQFSLQLENADTSAEQDVYIWLRKNGSDVAESATHMTVHKKHSGVNGASVAAWNFVVYFAATDYYELYWSATSTLVTMPYVAASATPPARPAIPSVILSVQAAAW